MEIRFQQDEVVTAVGFDAQGGGKISHYRTIKDAVVYDWLMPERKRVDVAVGSFVMVPFCSRIFRGRFNYNGREVALPLNDGMHAIHGHGFQSPWSVHAHSEDSLRIGYRYVPGAWPWAYEAILEARLDQHALVLSLSVHNHSDEAMPIGVGLHPYFPKTKKMTLAAQTGAQLCLSNDGMPVGVDAIPEDFSLAQGLHLGGGVLDDVFMDWSHRAHMTWPEYDAGLSMTASDNHRGLVIWAPAGEDFVGIEPVTQYPDGFNQWNHPWGAHDKVGAGAMYEAQWRLDPQFL